MLNRTEAPAFKKTTQFDLLKPESTLLKNGLAVHYLHGGQQDVIKIELLFRAGKWQEEKAGAGHFSGTLITKGTKTKSSFEIAKTFDFYGAHIEVNPGLDLISVSLYTLTKNLPSVLGLLSEIISESVFPEKELKQAKDIYLQNLKVNREKTSFQASVNFRKNLFGENHPYGRELEEKDIELLSTNDLLNHHTNFFKDCMIIVSGKFSGTNQELIDETFSRIERNPIKEKAHFPNADKPARLIIEKEGSIQASVRIGKRFIGRNNPDYFDVLLLNHMLGGYFGSRLMKNIREDKGLTYGIYSSIHTLMQDNYLSIGADVNKENLEMTFDEIRKELKRLRSELISPDELETARNHFIGSLQAEITTPFSHADKFKNIMIYSLPQDFYNRLIHRIDTISSKDLINTAEAYFHEESFYEIAVG
jgi:zinc protease